VNPKDFEQKFFEERDLPALGNEEQRYDRSRNVNRKAAMVTTYGPFGFWRTPSLC